MKTHGVLGGIRPSTASNRSREVYSALVRPICGWFWAAQYKRDLDIMGRVQQRAAKMVKVLEHLFYEERLKKLEKRRLGGISSMSINT